MTDLEQRIAQVAEDLRRLEEEMRRRGLAVTPEMAQVRRWEVGRAIAALYRRWYDFLLARTVPSAAGYRHLRRPLAHAPRPD